MKRFGQLFSFLFLALFAASSIAAGITEEQVMNLIAKVDAAAQSRNPAGVAASLSEDVVITINLHAGGKLETLRVGKREYLTMLREGWQMASSYSYARRNSNIRISGNTATVTSDVVEVATIQGQTLRTTTQEVATIEVIDGLPVVTRITGNARL